MLPPDLDEVDRELLVALQDDCRLSLSRLGERVGLSAPSVLERVRKLEAAGVIEGYHAKIAADRVGLGITAFVGVSMNFAKDVERFLAELGDRPEVLECHHITGAHSLLVKVKTQSTSSLEAIIGAMRAVDGVTSTETMVVLSTARETGSLALPEVVQSARISSSKRKGRRSRNLTG